MAKVVERKIMHSFRIEPSLLERVQEIAKREERDTSEVFRHALTVYCNAKDMKREGSNDGSGD